MLSEQILTRIEQINKEIDSIKNQYAKLEGHLIEAKFWLNAIQKQTNQDETEEGSSISETVNTETQQAA